MTTKGRPLREDTPSNTYIQFRCTVAEKEAWERCARSHNVSLSDWVRAALAKQEHKDRKTSDF